MLSAATALRTNASVFAALGAFEVFRELVFKFADGDFHDDAL